MFSRLHTPCFCAFCKAPRRIYTKKHIGLTNVVAALLLSTGTTFAIWGELDPRGLMLFCLIAFGSEILIYLRWRSALICSLCGFDPLVYKRSPQEAAERVREFYETSSEDPNFLLSRSPLVARQKQQRMVERQKANVAMLEERLKAKSLTPPKSV